jgi:outer membrane immunogenic protein
MDAHVRAFAVAFLSSVLTLTALSEASAQANVRPDGSIEVKGANEGPDQVNYPRGSDPSLEGLNFTKTGNRLVKVNNYPRTCQNPQLTNASDSLSECRREPGGGLFKYVVHSVKITCTNAPRERRIITFFEKTATPCTEEDYKRDSEHAGQAFGEKWTAAKTEQPKTGVKLNPTLGVRVLQPQSPAMTPSDGLYSWTGVYIGVHSGWAWGETGSLDTSGPAIGVQGGYNWGVSGDGTTGVIIGVSFDARWADISGSSEDFGFKETQRTFARFSAEGRAGYAFKRILAFISGGFAAAENRLQFAPASPGFGSDTHLHTGWTVGGGLEYLATNRSSVGIQYRYSRYGSERYFNNMIDNGRIENNLVTVMYNYHLGAPPPP